MRNIILRIKNMHQCVLEILEGITQATDGSENMLEVTIF